MSRVLRQVSGSLVVTVLASLMTVVGWGPGQRRRRGIRGRGAAERPNIVLITSDDQATSDMQWMPRTRRLVGKAGTRFPRAIAPNPLCCPARATLLTGQYSHNTGVRSNSRPHGG